MLHQIPVRPQIGRFLEWQQDLPPGGTYNIYAPGAVPMFIKGMLQKEVPAYNVTDGDPLTKIFCGLLTIRLSWNHFQGARFYMDAAVIRAIDHIGYEALKDELHQRILIDMAQENSLGQKRIIYDFMDEVGIIDMPNVSYDSLKKALFRRHMARKKRAAIKK